MGLFDRIGPAWAYLTGRHGSPYGQLARTREALAMERAEKTASMRLSVGAPSDIRYGPKIAGGMWGADPIVQLYHAKYGHPIAHEMRLNYFDIAYQAIPVLRSAISKRRAFEGVIVAMSKDAGLQTFLRDAWDALPVGYFESKRITKGGDGFIAGLGTASDKYGLGVGEIKMNVNGAGTRFEGIDRLLLPDMKTFGVRVTSEFAGGMPLFQLVQNTMTGQNIVDGPFVETMAYRCDGDTIWPHPLIYGLKSSVEVLLRMYMATANTVTRAGNPSNVWAFEVEEDVQPGGLMTVTLPDGTTAQVATPVAIFNEQLDQWARANYWGQTADLALELRNMKLNRQNIFENTTAGSVIGETEEIISVFEGEIIDASEVPPAMFRSGETSGQGMQSNKFQYQVNLALEAAEQRRKQNRRIAESIFNTMLLAENSGRFIGKFTIEFDAANLINEQAEEEVRERKANADSKFIANAFELYGMGEPAEVDEDGMPVASNTPNVMPPKAIEYLRRNGVILEE